VGLGGGLRMGWVWGVVCVCYGSTTVSGKRIMVLSPPEFSEFNFFPISDSNGPVNLVPVDAGSTVV
jgi:hypothetical protein